MSKSGVYLKVVTSGRKRLFETQKGLRFDIFPYKIVPCYNRMELDLFGLGFQKNIIAIYIWKTHTDSSSPFGTHIATFGIVNRGDQRWTIHQQFKEHLDVYNRKGISAEAFQEGELLYFDFLGDDEVMAHFDIFLKRSAANFSSEARWLSLRKTEVTACLQQEHGAVEKELQSLGWLNFGKRLKNQNSKVR